MPVARNHPPFGIAKALAGTTGQRGMAGFGAPDMPPIMVCGNSFPLVRAAHSNPLRSQYEAAGSQVTAGKPAGL
jgi:hypothetical protein